MLTQRTLHVSNNKGTQSYRTAFSEGSPVPDFAKAVVAAGSDDMGSVDERDGVDVVLVRLDLHRLPHRDPVVQVETPVVPAAQDFVAVLVEPQTTF